MIFINKNPTGKIFNVLYGTAQLVDGIVRIISLGFIATKFPITVSRYQMRHSINRMKDKTK